MPRLGILNLGGGGGGTTGSHLTIHDFCAHKTKKLKEQCTMELLKEDLDLSNR